MSDPSSLVYIVRELGAQQTLATPMWPAGFIGTVKAVWEYSDASGLRETLDYIYNIFNCADAHEMRHWFAENNVDVSLAQGPHVITILKMIAIKHGRANGQSSDKAD